MKPPHFKKRRKACGLWFGYRPVNAWGEGDLPAPYAEGDLLLIPPTSSVLILPNWRDREPGLFVVNSVVSIGDEDAWYVRVSPLDTPNLTSGRLYEIAGSRSDLDCEIVSTADRHGLTLRTRMLEDGWRPPNAAVAVPSRPCHTVSVAIPEG